MSELPDHRWLTSVDFTVAGVQLEGLPALCVARGFTMSRAELERALSLAERMEDRLEAMIRDMRNAPYVSAPANDPASSKYIGYRSSNNGQTDINGISGADEFYRGRLRAQHDYVRLLITKMREALTIAEASDEDSAADFRRAEEGC